MDNFINADREQLYQLNKLTQFMSNHKGFIAGGCFKNIFNNEKIKDIDIFFEKEVDFREAVKHFENDKDYNKYYENKKVVAFKQKESGIAVELIRSTFGTPQQVISKFDFSITKFAYYKETDGDSIKYTTVYHDKFFEHLHTKKLVLNKEIGFPVSTFERSLKYTKYGYGLCRESKENLIRSIREATLLDGISQGLYDGFD